MLSQHLTVYSYISIFNTFIPDGHMMILCMCTTTGKVAHVYPFLDGKDITIQYVER